MFSTNEKKWHSTDNICMLFNISMQWCYWHGELCTTLREYQWQTVILWFYSFFLQKYFSIFRWFGREEVVCCCLNVLTKLENFLWLRWNPDAIVFNSSKAYGTPSYWVQQFFAESSGATLHKTTLQTNSYNSLTASAISWESSEDNKTYLRIKVLTRGNIYFVCFLMFHDLSHFEISNSFLMVLGSRIMPCNSLCEGMYFWIEYCLIYYVICFLFHLISDF